MRIDITNFRGIARAAIAFADRATLVAGSNGAGKSSILQAIAAAISGRVLPIDGLSKSHSGRLVRGGTATSDIHFDSGSGQAHVTYPECVRITEGSPVEISPWATGERSLVHEPVKTRGSIVAELLGTVPTEAELAAECDALKIGAADAKLIISTVLGQGWNAAHKYYQERGARLKGRWEGITGERYGTKKAEAWLPAGWDPELEEASERDLNDTIKQERAWLEAAIADEAIDTDRKAELKKKADLLMVHQGDWDEIERQHAALKKNIADMENGIRKIKPPEQPAAQPCPKCGASLIVESGQILEASPLSSDEIKKRAEAVKSAQESLTNALRELQNVAEKRGKIHAAVTESKRAQGELERMEKKRTEFTRGNDTAGSVDDIRARLTRAENRLAATRTRADAEKIAAQILRHRDIVTMLAPDGLRMSKLKTRIGSFQDRLDQVSGAARWKATALRCDMGISYGGTPYMLCSKSEQYRARIALQIAISLFRGDQVVLLDDADILDATGRNGLFRMLISLPIRSIVGMTIHPDRLPQLPDHCRLYWIDNSQAEEICQTTPRP